MSGKIETMLADAHAYIASLVRRIDESGLSSAILAIDHVCYRVADLPAYEYWKEQLAVAAELLTESYVNGRPIAVFKLKESLRVGSYTVEVVELPAPKSGRPYQEGFEHIEAVTSEPLEAVIARFGQLGIDTSNLGAHSNRDIQLKFSEGLVKLHESSLARIIEQEKAEKSARKDRRLAVIDFDDTLVNSRSQFLAATHAALCQYLKRDISIEECTEKARPTFPDFFGNFGITDLTRTMEVISIFRQKWALFAEDVTVPVGMKTALSCLRSEGVSTVIWTARDARTTADFLQSSELTTMIDEIYAFDELGVSKPLPPPALVAAAAAGKTVVVGDSVSDFKGAQALHGKFLQAAWVHTADLQAGNDALCKTPMDFLNKTLTYFKDN